MEKTANRNPRIAELDGLRGVAAFSVLLFHYTATFDHKYGHPGHLPFYFILGRYGVELFFMISGYVIFMTLDRSRNAADFAFARFSRLYPAYWACVLLTFSLVGLLGLPGEKQPLGNALINLSMIQALWEVPHVDYVYWTLHKELGFYLLAGLILATGLRSRAIYLFAGLIVLDATIRYLTPIENVPGLWRIYALFPLQYLYLFFIGIAVYELGQGRSLPPILLPASMVLCATLITQNWGQVAVVGAILLLFTYSIISRLSLLCSRPFQFLGMVSYPLYLLHANIGYALIIRLEQQGWSSASAIFSATLVSLILASAVCFLIERPAMRQFRKWRQEKRLKFHAG